MSENKLTVIGKILAIGETQTFGSNGFQKRELIIETPGDYPQPIKLEVIKDKCEYLDKYSIGQEVECSFNIRGNYHNGNVYNNLQCWFIKATENNQQLSAPPQHDQPAAASADIDDSDIPF